MAIPDFVNECLYEDLITTVTACPEVREIAIKDKFYHGSVLILDISVDRALTRKARYPDLSAGPG